MKLLPFLLLLVVASCGGTARPCASTCSGCCDSSGTCRQSGSAAACGLGGVACQTCAGAMMCIAGVCSTTGSTGGGSATGGGSTAGGSTAGGSTAGGSTAGGSTAGGSTAGGSTAGGSTAGGSTAGGSTAGGSTAGGSTSGGTATGGGSAPDASVSDGGAPRDGGCVLSFGTFSTIDGGGAFIATGDYDHDGRPDLAWSNPFATDVRVSLNSATGFRPSARTTFPFNSWPAAFTSTDVDLDGFDDLVVGDFFGNVLVFMRNDQQGRFARTTNYQVQNVWAVNSAPLDQTPGDDLVVSSAMTDVLVLRNVNAALALPNPWATDGGLAVYGNCIGDLRGAGVNDVVALSGLGPGLITVLHNDGNARFSVFEQLATQTRPFACTIADLDGDGRRDLIVRLDVDQSSAGSVQLFRQTSTGRLQPFGALDALASTTPPAVSDLDHDGRLDVLLAHNRGDGGVYLTRVLEDGGLLPPRRLATPVDVAAVIAVDVNADGLDDVVGVGSAGAFVLPNTCR